MIIKRALSYVGKEANIVIATDIIGENRPLSQFISFWFYFSLKIVGEPNNWFSWAMKEQYNFPPDWFTAWDTEMYRNTKRAHKRIGH